MKNEIKFKILNKDWKAMFVPEDNPGLRRVEGSFIGVSDYEHYTIFISNVLNPIRTKEVLIHELTHATITQLNQNRDSFNQEDVAKYCERYTEFIYNTASEILKARKDNSK